MNEMIALVNEKMQDFDITDWSIFKGLLILVGMIIGCSFAETCKKLRPLLVIVWVCLFTYMMLKMFVLEKE